MMIAVSKKFIILCVLILCLVGWMIYETFEIDHPPGILVEEEPTQIAYRSPKKLEMNGYTLNLKADFRIRARVLASERYRIGDDADFVPLDLALGWREMSDTKVLDDIEIDQYGRWYTWRVKGQLPVPRQVISRNSSNVHIIPSSRTLRDRLLDIRVGEILTMKGYLVDVTNPFGFSVFKSSMSRDDTGAGACEVLLVTDYSRE